jgi:hypothetical protein
MTLAEAHAYGIDVTECSEQLFMVKGGNLVERSWVTPDRITDAIYPAPDSRYEYEFINASEAAPYAFNNIQFTSDVILADVFKFMLANPAYQAIIGCWAKEVSERGLSHFIPLHDLDGDIEYLEVYSMNSLENHDVYYCDDTSESKELPIIPCNGFPSFHGIGVELKEDQKEDEGPWKKGERIMWGISSASAETLAALPVRLNQTHKIFDERLPFNHTMYVPVLTYTRTYTLIEVLKAIFHEMTWYGPPEELAALKESSI